MQHLESNEQKAVIKWARLAQREYPCLKWLHCSLSGVKLRSAQEGARLKAEGMVAGISDIYLPYPNGKYAGLYIEMKKRNIKGQSKGVVSQAQKEFIDYANSVGYKAVVCYGADEAITTIKKYLSV